MVWTDVVGDPVDAEGEPLDGGRAEEPAAVPAPMREGNPALDEKTPPAEIAELTRADVDSTLREVQAGIAGLTSRVTAFNERSAAQESIITRMQQRLEELQGDQVRALLRPVFEQLGALHGDITAIAERELKVGNDARLGKELAFLANRVETAFESLGLVSVEADTGVEFDSRLHAAVRSKPTPEAALDKSIAEVQRQGFMTPGTTKPELHARVVVYSYDPHASIGDETTAAAPTEAVLAAGSAPGVPEALGSVPAPAAARRAEQAPQVPLPPLPPSYVEGS